MPAASTIFALSWGLWALSWIVAALWADRDARRATPGLLWLAYTLICGSVAAALLWQTLGLPSGRWWDVGPIRATVLGLATVPGFAFAWWARLHLGRLWSAQIVAKADHRIVETGPYARVRHPIYTGILWAALVTDIAGANAPSVLSFLCLFAGFRLKAGLEEAFLEQIFSRALYADYRRRVPMLMPRLWPSRTSSGRRA